MPVGGGGIQGLIQTIVMLQNLRSQQEATQLARERFGLEKRQTGAQILGSVLQGLPGYSNPSQFVGQNVGELAELTGASPGFLQSAAAQTPPAVATTRAGAVQRGAQAAGGALDQPAAYGAIAGTLPGGLEQDKFAADIFGGARGYLSELPDDQKQQFMARVAEKSGSGMSPSQAMFDEAKMRMSPQELAQAVRIGADLAPGANADAQTRLGWARQRLDQRQFEWQSGLEEMKVRAAIEGKEREMGAQAFKETNDLITKRAEFLTNASKMSATLTPQGAESYINQINAYNAQIRAAAPTIYGPGAPNEIKDIPVGKNVSTISLTDAIMSYLMRPH
jgi:hypothetical protein